MFAERAQWDISQKTVPETFSIDNSPGNLAVAMLLSFYRK